MALNKNEQKIYFVRGSFNAELRTALSALVADINSAYGSSYSVAFYPQRTAETLPCVRSWFFAGGGVEKNRFTQLVQISIFTKSNPGNPDTRLPTLLMGGILNRLGFDSKRNAFYKFLNISDAPNSVTNESYRLSIESTEGWSEMPDEEENVWHHHITLKLTHR
jgi:hypothetical protein